ncbi:unnamed protein product, partial [Hapterophycus canaliculatus]
VWVAAGASSLTEKYLAMILPVSAFVAFGAEHSVRGWLVCRGTHAPSGSPSLRCAAYA